MPKKAGLPAPPAWLVDVAFSGAALLSGLWADGLVAFVTDLLFYVGFLLLAPFSQSLSRRCHSRALRLDAPTHRILHRTNVPTATVNGNTLRGSLWLPAGEPGPFPAVLIRTPYGQPHRLVE